MLPKHWGEQRYILCSLLSCKFTVEFTLFQDPSDFVHQHLALFVEIDTKSYVGSLSFFHLTTVRPHHTPPNPKTKWPHHTPHEKLCRFSFIFSFFHFFIFSFFRRNFFGLKCRLRLLADTNKAPILPTGDLPADFDWRNKGVVTSVKDQTSLIS
ncbi:hypothetical protein DVH24_002065 [Malus domestica]|uniref:Uncharacterized protein n=1 Tax=Malus domestica TaxID=3750 RepID=A0A498I986_MALDO|nr:hypothetical protein DVH24_002065 [Malus domestica]